ncbi:hypothetical protein H010_03312 [Hydrogenophaga taeniospiralis CCUG 15921]|uniref:Uncharacterized protein n=1 Tax=Hydrogenophaga taeniospiralis CCUG 15921 TaxID=1281780 RepID=A0A9X4P1G0_9BURK|nr:hypothetical protein [Hydrogenophaga taeniospiralis]MDG5974263.1 hypothetical protein [Hydrogenophaga taeniospiralis CCUG 15921]
MISSCNPLERYIHEQIEHFGQESKRLGSSEPLKKFKSITDAFLKVQQCLGTLQHEVALDVLKKEFALVRRDIVLSVKWSWKDFWRYRTLATQSAKWERDRRQVDEIHQRELAASIARLRVDKSPLAVAAEDIYGELLDLEAISLDMSPVWRGMSWAGLWVDSKIFAIYAQYLRARVRVFLQFHSFIFLVPILVLGIGYSAISKGAIEGLTATYSSLPWLGSVVLVGIYALKKYVIDKKLKAVQKKVEESLFRPLCARLMIVRTVVLQTQTWRGGRKHWDGGDA